MGDTSTPPTSRPSRLYPLHQLMLDLLRANPGWTALELAAELELSVSWVRYMISTDAFRAALAAQEQPA